MRYPIVPASLLASTSATVNNAPLTGIEELSSTISPSFTGSPAWSWRSLPDSSCTKYSPCISLKYPIIAPASTSASAPERSASCSEDALSGSNTGSPLESTTTSPL